MSLRRLKVLPATSRKSGNVSNCRKVSCRLSILFIDGMGPDAHTASLFPGEPLIGDRTGTAAAVYVSKLKMHRVTLLPGVLLAAKKTVLLAAGDDKAEPLFQVLRGPEDPFRFPCQVATRGALNALWFIDRAAAAKL